MSGPGSAAAIPEHTAAPTITPAATRPIRNPVITTPSCPAYDRDYFIHARISICS